MDQYGRRSNFTTKPSAVVNKVDESVVQLKKTLAPQYLVLPISALKRRNVFMRVKQYFHHASDI